MKKVFLSLMLALAATFAVGQSFTPNIQLQLPAHGAPNWDAAMNSNFNILDLNIGILQVPFRGTWNSGVTYVKAQQVSFGGALYISTANGNLNNQPDLSPSVWSLMLPSALIGNPQGTATISTNFNSFNKVFQGSYFDGALARNNNWEFAITTTPTSGSTVNNRFNFVPSFSTSCPGCTSDFAIGGGGTQPTVGDYPTLPWWLFKQATDGFSLSFQRSVPFTTSRTKSWSDADGVVVEQVSTAFGSQTGNGTSGLSTIPLTAGSGGATTGTTGQIGGAGGNVQIAGGTGGNAPGGSTNGTGGNTIINGGAPGGGAGTAGTRGSVVLQQSAGNVGIGTSSPTQKLHIRGAAPQIQIDNTTGGGLNYAIRNGSVSTGILDIGAFGGSGSFSNVPTLSIVDGGGSGGANEVRIGSSTNIVQNSSRLYVFGGLNGANIDVQGDGATFDSAGVEVEGSDYATNLDSTRIDFYGNAASGLGTTLGFTNQNMGRLIFQSGIAGGAVGIIINHTAKPIVVGVNDQETGRFTDGGNFSVAIGNPTTASFEVPGSMSFDALPIPGVAMLASNPTSGGSCTAGTHTWKMTFVNAVGETTTNAATAIKTCSGPNGTVPLSFIPIGPVGTTARKIYRTVAGNTGNYLLVTTLNDNTTTTFSDTIADGSLGAAAPTTNTTAQGKLQVQDASGTNIVGGTLTVRSALPTGNATPPVMQIDGGALGGGSGSSLATQVHREIFGASKNLTNNTTTTVSNITDASNTSAAVIVHYAVEIFDGTNVQYETGLVMCAINNKAGAFTQNTCTKTGNIQGVTSGTLTITWTITAANPALLQINSNSSLTTTTNRVTYNLENLTQQAVSIQ